MDSSGPAPDGGAWIARTESDPPPPTGLPLDGLGVCVKDVIDVAGMPTTGGSSDWRRDPTRDAPSVTALRAAGAHVLGKGHTNEFAYGIDGLNPFLLPCLNPHDGERLCGGSSSGPAVAVASGEAEIGLGTDTSGSLRVPAAFCGLYALRPTHGLVSVEGLVPLAPSMDTCGVLAASPIALARATNALASWRTVPEPDVDYRRAGLLRVGGCAAQIAERLAALGVEVVDVELPSFVAARSVHHTIQSYEASRVHRAMFGADRPRYSSAVGDRLRAGDRISEREAAAARASRDAYRAAVWERFDRAGLDLVLLPVTPFVAPPRDAREIDGVPVREAILRYVAPLSLLGAPVLTVPAQTQADGLPLGVQILGRPGQDRNLLSLAQVL